MVKIIEPELLDYDSIPTPKPMLLVGYLLDTLAFPVQLVVTTYVLTWLRFKLDRSCKTLLSVTLLMAFLRFLQQVILNPNRGVSQLTNT
jgi:hypothetical protein